MADFVSTPPPKKERIPTPTLDDLISALEQYLPTAFDFQYFRSDIWPEREFGLSKTTLYFYDQRRADARAAIEIEVSGKFAQSGSARLWADPFLLMGWVIPLSEPFELPSDDWEKRKAILAKRTYVGILVIPRADRSIAFRAVKRWEDGQPIFDD
jgi:hypothetical protein